ncbi:hypothetical protein L7F22_053102, partial [Adiantum nelumboides]|nr:hypothetical protein [Adiantum nelumboides]
WRVVSLIKKR